jgi:heat shock protein HtpX
MPVEYYQAISSNKAKTWLLLAAFAVMIIMMGWVFGELLSGGLGILGVVLAFIISIIYALIGYYSGDRVVLWMSGAREAAKSEFPYYYNTVEGLSIAAGIPMPKLYVMEDAALNAFATGRDPQHASVAATTGLLKAMNRAELEGVLAHELSHVKNLDIRVMTIATVLAGVIVFLADIFGRMLWHSGGGRDRRGSPALAILGLLFIILAPIAAQLIRLAVSRQREYLADASAVELTRIPDGLQSALTKIAGDKNMLRNASHATAHLFISNPFKQERGIFASLAGLFSTHPPIDDRIKRLADMGAPG